MRTLTDREKRTVRVATVGIAIYLAIFFGVRSWKFLEQRRSDYRRLVRDAERLKQQIQPYQEKATALKKLMENFHLDPAKLSKASVVAETSAAIQKAAAGGGVQIGPIRESSARSSAKEVASMQLEISGQVQAVMALLHHLDTLGYPLIIDSVQINSDTGRQPGAMGPMPPMGPMQPGMLKLSLTIVILDYEQWKNEEKGNV